MCDAQYPGMDGRYRCDCGGTLDVIHDPSEFKLCTTDFDKRRNFSNSTDRSGVWRFRELILPFQKKICRNVL